MVDLGQKGWKQFHLFYWNKVSIKEEEKDKNIDKKNRRTNFSVYSSMI
jgi:hypothetical protein